MEGVQIIPTWERNMGGWGEDKYNPLTITPLPSITTTAATKLMIKQMD